MIDYTSWQIIGRGTERTCYRHPEDATRCVKIARSDRTKQTLREIGYFSYLAGKGVPFEHIPRFYGKVRTSDSVGIEQELVVDRIETDTSSRTMETSPSKTIDQYFSSPRTPDEIAAFWQAIGELKEWLLKYNVLALGIDHNNVVVNRTADGNIRLILIDGVYDTEWIPVSKYIPFFGRKKILRRWARFMKQLQQRYPYLFAAGQHGAPVTTA